MVGEDVILVLVRYGLPLLGLVSVVLPPRHAIRLGGAGIVALVILAISFREEIARNGVRGVVADTGLSGNVIFFFAAMSAGLVLRMLRDIRQWRQFTLSALAAPRADQALVFWAMAIPAGLAVLALDPVLQGNRLEVWGYPVAILLMAGVYGIGLLGLRQGAGLFRASLSGFAFFVLLLSVFGQGLPSVLNVLSLFFVWLPFFGLVLPARYSLRVAAAFAVLLMSMPIYLNARNPLDDDWGDLGQAMMTLFFVLLFGFVVAGLVMRAVWHLWHKRTWSLSVVAAPRADRALAFWAMIIPAGLVALMLGSVLAGNPAPLGTHLVLLAGLAVLVMAGWWITAGPVRAGMSGFAFFLGLIVVDSMRLEDNILATLATVPPEACLLLGPDRLTVDEVPRLMGLTVPKPVILISEDEPDGYARWSFRFRGFVRYQPDDPPRPRERPLPCAPLPP